MKRHRDANGPRRRGFDDDFGPRDPDPFAAQRAMAPRAPRPTMESTGPTIDATVKWFNGEKGFGFVELSDGTGDAFLHIRAVEAAGHSDLQPGTRLVVRTAQGQKGPQVTEVTEVDTSTAQPAAPRGDRPPRPMGGGGGYGGGGGGYGGGGGRYGGGGGSGGGFRQDRTPSGPSVEMTGTVKWYNPEKGFGFLSVEDGGKDVFIHRSALARAGLTSLQEGQSLRVEVVEGQKGREVSSITEAD